MANGKVIIKKYENRRLYDTAGSRYVNLEEVAQMVRDGIDVQVVDASTGEDLTRVVLTQIIMESARGRDSALPVDMLRQMIMNSGAVSQEAMLKYMKATLDMYQNAYRAFIPPPTPFDYMQRMMGTPSTNQREVEELRRRVEELEKMIEQSRNRPPRKTNSPKKRG